MDFRDYALGIGCWAVSLLAAAAVWAESPPGDSNWSSRLGGILFGGVAAALPAVWLVREWARRRNIWQELVDRFRRPETVGVLALLFGVGQVCLLSDSFLKPPLLPALLVVLGGLIVMWLFAGRRVLEIRAVGLAAAWWIALLGTRRAFDYTLNILDPARASWRGQLFVVGVGTLLVILAVLPIGLMRRQWAAWLLRATGRLAPWLPWMLGLSLGLAVTLQAGNQFSNWADRRTVLISELAQVSLVLIGGLMVLARPEGDVGSELPPLPRASRQGRRTATLGLVAVLIAFALVAIQIPPDDNPDGLAYLSIARSYSEGSIAVRGYWSPLLSWLMAPAMALGAAPTAAYRLISVIAGCALIIGSFRLARKLGLGLLGQLLAGVMAALFGLSVGIHPLTPDLLSAACVTLYLYVLTGFRESAAPWRTGLWAGAAGALAYYAKYYNMAFFLVHFVASGLLLIPSGSSRKKKLVPIVIGVAVFFSFSLPWALALGSRYGGITFTTSSGIARAVFAPSATDHPCWKAKLCPEPTDVLFPWEDPQASDYPTYGWSPLESLDSIRHEIRLIWAGLSTWVAPSPFGPSTFPPAWIIVFLALGMVSWRGEGRRKDGFWLLTTVGLYIGGYLLGSSGSLRYYLPVMTVFWIGNLAAIQAASRTILHRHPSWLGTSAIPILLPALAILSFPWVDPIRNFVGAADKVDCYTEVDPRVRSYLEAPMAGTDFAVNFLAFHTKVRTVGAIPGQWQANEAAAQMEALGVRSLVVAEADPRTLEWQRDFGYDFRGEVTVCGKRFIILRLP